jgi:predicted O-methyltransferase YrrM
MARKGLSRLSAQGPHPERAAATEWASHVAVDMGTWASAIDHALWRESVEFANDMRRAAAPVIADLENLGIDLGGGGSYELLYFLVRKREPAQVLESGVAAGWSTRAILSAMEANGRGELYSSDFPYFRIANPEKYIGILVPEELRGSQWHLFTKGDRANLKRILSHRPIFGVVHYDSDKRRKGRSYFLRETAPYLKGDAVVIMDDINDDMFFAEEMATDGRHVVFEYNGKFIGLIGDI